MERLIRDIALEAVQKRRLSRRVQLKFDAGALLSDAALFLVSLLLASYSPFDGLSPFGAACVMAAWAYGCGPYSACAGAVLGYALSGSWVYAVSTFVLGLTIFLINRQGSIERVFRLLVSFAVQLISVLIISLLTKQRTLFLAGALTVSVFASVVLACGIKAFAALSGSRTLSDAELLTLAATAGLITLAMRNYNLRGVSPAMVFAGACSLFAAYRIGVPAVAFAVTVGAGRVLASGGDMHFIAVLAACTLVSSSLRSLGKWASLAGFTLLGACFALFLRGSYIFNLWELGIIFLVYAAIPARLYFPEAVKNEIEFCGKGVSKYGRLQYRVAEISESLFILSGSFAGNESILLRSASNSLKKALKEHPCCNKLEVEYGTAEYGSAETDATGDRHIINMLEGGLLAALSDGMGSGSTAGEASEAVLELFSELICLGIEFDKSAELVNDVFETEQNELYATLDAVLIDLSDGSARILKQGAPESYVLREGTIYSLYGEGVPMGITEKAPGYASSFKLIPGDTLIMMTDGVSEALGDSLIPAIANNVLEFGDAEMAANSLLDAAAERGSGDDMTVMVIRLSEKQAIRKSR